MSKTIFCSFDDRDVADIAMGQLKASVHGIQSISFLESEHDRHDHGHDGFAPFAAVPFANGSLPFAANGSAMIGGFIALDSSTYNGTPENAGPVSVKITCADSSKRQVMSRLVNLHAYKITAAQ